MFRGVINKGGGGNNKKIARPGNSSSIHFVTKHSLSPRKGAKILAQGSAGWVQPAGYYFHPLCKGGGGGRGGGFINQNRGLPP